MDEAPSHLAAKSQALAAPVGLVRLWLPQPCAELNAMDQLWRELKSPISAHYPYPTVAAHAAAAEAWILSLTPTEALRKAGILSPNFWLKSFLK